MTDNHTDDQGQDGTDVEELLADKSNTRRALAEMYLDTLDRWCSADDALGDASRQLERVEGERDALKSILDDTKAHLSGMVDRRDSLAAELGDLGAEARALGRCQKALNEEFRDVLSASYSASWQVVDPDRAAVRRVLDHLADQYLGDER